MSADFQLTIAVTTFCVVILVIAFDWLDMTVAALLGVVVLALTRILNDKGVLDALQMGGGTLALLFGGMVVARVLGPTGVLDYAGGWLLRFTRGSGRRLLFGLIVFVGVVCAFLPNATVILLLAPVLIRVASKLKIDFVPLLILAAIVSNAAGLLTKVGDPATFVVASAIHMSFGEYLARASLGGLLSILVIVPFLPWLFQDIWRMRIAVPSDLPLATIQRPAFAVVTLLILIVMVILFVVGENLLGVGSPAVAILGATLALLVVYGWKIEPVNNVFADIDWKTLLFLICMFFMVQALVGTGLLFSVSRELAGFFGTNMIGAAMALLVGVGAASGVLANIPIVAAMVVLVKGYLILIDAVPEEALGVTYLQSWPEQTLPVFIAMMFGATLGGNATVVGASANIIAAGIAQKNGGVMNFVRFARFGVPIALAQLFVCSIYILVLNIFLGH